MTAITPRYGEVAFAFNCHGDELIGFLHKGDPHCDIGVLTIVAGGPQYRAGVGRQLVNLGRHLASEGIPVMRFDHRGMGDSEGSPRRFKAIQDDIAAAINEFKRHAPNVRSVILWGGCDAGTSVLINAYKYPEVVAVIAGNPYVSTPATANKVARKHYVTRLMQASFWLKLVRLEYKLGDYATAALQKLRNKIFSSDNRNPAAKPDNNSDSFLDDLLTGLRKFEGRVLFLMGDRFLLSDEFDALMASSPEWRFTYAKSTHDRIDIKGGDQVFSSRDAQEQMSEAASTWIHRAFPGKRPLLVVPSRGRQIAQSAIKLV